jgi:SAM-dependent methyltransferase
MSSANGHSPRTCTVCRRNAPQDWLRAPDRFHGRQELYRLVRCPSCSLVWLDNPPPPDEMAEHYGTDYDTLIAAVGEADVAKRWRKPREVLLRYKSGGAILDLGASSGGFLASLKDRPWELHGVEISETVARRAQENTGAKMFVGDVMDAPYAPDTFDAITCFHVLEHLYQPREVLEKVREWLKPGGIFITYLPNIDSGAARLFGSYWYALELPRHLYHFSPVALRQLAQSVGFDEVEISTHREPFIPMSARYFNDAILRKLGVSRVPPAYAGPRSLPWRAMRKAFKLTMLPVLDKLVAMAGPGEIMHAVLKKPDCVGAECRKAGELSA